MMHWLTTEIKTLLASGVFGSVVRILLNPDKEWQKWIVQAFVGVSAAVFLGQVVGHLIIQVVGDTGATGAYSAAGFLIGTAAEKAIEKLQHKFLD
jgi:hypothetical protein